MVLAQESATAMSSVPRAFDGQLSEVDDLLDARAKLGSLRTLAADDRSDVTDRSSRRSFCSCCHRSNTRWSGTSTVSDIFGEDGRIRTPVLESWLGEKKSHSGSHAKVTSRGVDCRLNLGGKVCEWVVFL